MLLYKVEIKIIVVSIMSVPIVTMYNLDWFQFWIYKSTEFGSPTSDK